MEIYLYTQFSRNKQETWFC